MHSVKQSPLLPAAPAKHYDIPSHSTPDGTHHIFDTLSLLQHVATRPVCQSISYPHQKFISPMCNFPCSQENNLGNYKTIRDCMFENLGYMAIISTVTNKPVRARGGWMKYHFACRDSKTSALLNSRPLCYFVHSCLLLDIPWTPLGTNLFSMSSW